MDSKDLDNSKGDSWVRLAPIQQLILKEMTKQGSAYQIKINTNNNNILDKLYTPYIVSKLTQIIQRNKNIIPTTDKLKKLYTKL